MTDGSSMMVSSPGSAESTADGRAFFDCPFVFGREGSFCLSADVLASASFAVLFAKAAVGLVMRSRKLPSTGALGFLLAVCELRDSGRPSEGRPALVGFVRVDAAAGLATGAEGPSTRAREAAVGAVSREEISTGLVGSRGFCFGPTGLEAAALSAAAARATDAAVGADSDARLGFLLIWCGEAASLVGAVVDCGDLRLTDGRDGLLAVEMAEGFGRAGLLAVLFSPLTASALVGSAGFITAGSSSAPVTGLSGFAASLSALSTCPTFFNGAVSFFSGELFAAVRTPSCLSASTSGVSTACCGMRSPSSAIVALNACTALLFLSSLKLVRLPRAVVASMASLASLLGILLKSGAEAMFIAGLLLGDSTAMKEARILERGRCWSSAARPPGDLPLPSGVDEFCAAADDALVSKSERRFRTADEDRSGEDISWEGSIQLACDDLMRKASWSGST